MTTVIRCQVKLTGAKSTDKKYYWHTGYPGGLKTKTAKDYMEDRWKTLSFLTFLPFFLSYY